MQSADGGQYEQYDREVGKVVTRVEFIHDEYRPDTIMYYIISWQKYSCKCEVINMEGRIWSSRCTVECGVWTVDSVLSVVWPPYTRRGRLFVQNLAESARSSRSTSRYTNLLVYTLHTTNSRRYEPLRTTVKSESKWKARALNQTLAFNRTIDTKAEKYSN